MLCVMKVALVPNKAVLHFLLYVLSLRKDKVQFSCRETQMCVLLLAKLTGICQAAVLSSAPHGPMASGGHPRLTADHATSDFAVFSVTR